MLSTKIKLPLNFPSQREARQHFLAVAVTATTFIGLTWCAPDGANGAAPGDIQLQVGIVQRFGDEQKDKLTIASPDPITLRFNQGTGQPQTLQTKQIELEISRQPLPNPT